jgi:hypothetical protein
MENSAENAPDAPGVSPMRPAVVNFQDAASTIPRAAAAALAPPKTQRFRTWSVEQKEALVVEITQGTIKVLMLNKVSKLQELTIIDPAKPFPHGSKSKFYEQLIKHLETDKVLFPLSPNAVQVESLWIELLTTRMLQREKLKNSGTGHKRKRVGEYRTGDGAGQDNSEDSSGSDAEQAAAEEQDRIDDLLDAFIARQENLHTSVVVANFVGAIDEAPVPDATITSPHVEKKGPKEKVKESQSIEEASNGKGGKNREKLEKLPSCADKAKQQMMESSTSRISSGLDLLSESMKSDSAEVFATKAQAVMAPIASVFKEYQEASRDIAKAESQAVIASTERQWEGVTKCISDSVNAFKEIYFANNPRGPQPCLAGQSHNFASLGSLVLCTNCGMRA